MPNHRERKEAQRSKKRALLASQLTPEHAPEPPPGSDAGPVEEKEVEHMPTQSTHKKKPGPVDSAVPELKQKEMMEYVNTDSYTVLASRGLLNDISATPRMLREALVDEYIKKNPHRSVQGSVACWVTTHLRFADIVASKSGVSHFIKQNWKEWQTRWQSECDNAATQKRKSSKRPPKVPKKGPNPLKPVAEAEHVSSTHPDAIFDKAARMTAAPPCDEADPNTPEHSSSARVPLEDGFSPLHLDPTGFCTLHNKVWVPLNLFVPICDCRQRIFLQENICGRDISNLDK